MKSDEVITMIIDPTLETEDAMVYQVPECKERPVEAMLIKNRQTVTSGLKARFLNGLIHLLLNGS